MPSVFTELKNKANPEKAALLRRYFKTGKGEYGEGDIFLGVIVPQQREIAKKFYEKASFDELKKLLASRIHEHRFTALEILVMKYEKAENIKEKKRIFDFYIKNRRGINNWDLVDTSAPYIVGDYLRNKPRDILYKLVMSKNIWDRRIAVLATFYFIKNNDFTDAVTFAKILLDDPHQLIHKASGWMLREIGKKDEKILLDFLDNYHKVMPSIMRSYALEKLPKTTRIKYNNKHVPASS